MAQNNTIYPNGVEVRARLIEKAVVTTDATASAVTYTAPVFIGGPILRDPNGAGRSDVTPSAALIDAELDAPAVGASVRVIIRNTADAAETITITAGNNVTLSGTMTIAQNNTKESLLVKTAATPAYTLYSVGTFVH